MNIVLVAVNAKYCHSSLALRSLVSYCEKHSAVASGSLSIKEFTINQSHGFIVSELYKLKPDVLCFSCYIWNIELVKAVMATLQKALPEVKMVMGGPEADCGAEQPPGVTVIEGEGEAAFCSYVNVLLGGAACAGGEAVPLDGIPFVYRECDLHELKNRILYYETSRGCPHGCAYCLSGRGAVRFLSLERVFSDLRFFLENRVPQVKLVDRTFNCDAKRALAIWEYLIANDNGVTNFHFEIAADCLTDGSIDVLSKARAGFFQFEIGVQSTNEQTLRTVSRKTDTGKIAAAVAKLRAAGNIHLHLDLIAGLPDESYEQFKDSFNTVYAMRPDRLQLGFLKLLKGSALRENAERLGIAFDSAPPYEVLYTKDISFAELLRLKEIEDVLELFHNSGRFGKTLPFLTGLYDAPFDFYEELAEYWTGNGYHAVLHNKTRLYDLLYKFCAGRFPELTREISDLLIFDLYLCDNVKTPPFWAEANCLASGSSTRRFYNSPENIERVLPRLKHCSPAQLAKMCNIVHIGRRYFLFAYGGGRGEAHDITEFVDGS